MTIEGAPGPVSSVFCLRRTAASHCVGEFACVGSRDDAPVCPVEIDVRPMPGERNGQVIIVDNPHINCLNGDPAITDEVRTAAPAVPRLPLTVDLTSELRAA